MKSLYRNTHTISPAALMLAAMLFTAPNAFAQRVPGQVALGAQVGEPSGVSLMVYSPRGMSYDFLAAWDMNDFFFLNAHGLFEKHFGRSERAHFFYGPGAFIGIEDRPRGSDDDVVAGVSGRLGIGYLFDRFEVYGQITPRLALAPATDGDVGGGIGFRVYL